MIRVCEIFLSIVVVITGLSCAGNNIVRAPLTPVQIDSLLTTADSLLTLEEYSAASDLYDMVWREHKQMFRALRGRGLVAIGMREWGRAMDAAHALENVDSVSALPAYIEGIVHRERGINQPFHVEWGAARDAFEQTLARDSAFEDALYQFALLERYRDDHIHAIPLAERQVALRPDVLAGKVGLLRMFRYFVAVEDSESVFAWLQSCRGEMGQYAQAEALRKYGLYARADSLLGQILAGANELPPQAPLLTLARTALARGERNEAEGYYQRAITGLQSLFGGAILWEDIKYIVSDEEFAQFRTLTTVREQREFFNTFWSFRNPSPASAGNPRMVEHLRRMLVAEKEYSYYGFRQWFNNPDELKDLKFPRSFSLNAEFNDKGMVFLRHGEPTSVMRSMGDFAGDPAESWLYEGTTTTPRMIFHFQKHNSAAANWRLTSVPANTSLIEDLQTWDVKYRNLLSDNAFDKMNFADRLRGEAQQTVRYGLSTEEHTWENKRVTIEIPHAVDAFRGSLGRGLVDISFAIPLPLLARDLGDTARRVDVEVGLSITESRARRDIGVLDTIPFMLSRASNGYFVDLYRYTLPADSYAVAMHIRPLQGDIFGNWQQTVRVRDFVKGGLALSSLQILFPSNEKSLLEIDGIKVRQSPFAIHVRTKPLYVYFQGYNLVKDDFGATHYLVECILVPIDERTDEGDVVLRNEKKGKEETAAEFYGLDVKKIGAGVYRLVVRLTDKNRVHTVTTERIVEIRKP